jgi:signal transduction histidine kinase
MIQYSINSAVDRIKVDIQKADEIVSSVSSFKQNVFYNVHQMAHAKLKNNPSLNIEKLKSELMQILPHKYVNIHIYLINRDYLIYQTTYQPDLNLNMRNLSGAKEYIDDSFKAIDKIFFSTQPSFDVLTNEYRIYSYSAINDTVVLELGFFDNALSKIKDRLYQFNLHDSILKDVDIYADYGTYIINISKDKNLSNISKEEYLKGILNKRDTFLTKMVETKGRYHYDFQEDNKQYRICYRYIDRSRVSNTQFKHYVLRAKVDITKFQQQLQQLKYTLYITSTIVVLFILLLVVFFIKTIINPFRFILERLTSTGNIEDAKILSKKDEFGELSSNINKMSYQLSSTQQEITQKSFQLQRANEALKELNLSLQDRIQEEVHKNRIKDQQLLTQSRLAQMGEMIAMIAHQWRQPLAAINSIALNLQLKSSMKQSGLDSSSLLRNAQDISKYALHLSETIDEFRDFFKPHKSQKETTFDEIIQSVLKIIQESLEVHNIKITQDLKYHESFVAYPNELKHVVLNLLKNSQDAFIDNTIEDRSITIKTYCENEFKILEVTDNAGGVSSDIMDKIFDPYFSTKSNKNGTGLGLYMSKMIIEKHSNGKIEVNTQNNQTTFKIIL